MRNIIQLYTSWNLQNIAFSPTKHENMHLIWITCLHHSQQTMTVKPYSDYFCLHKWAMTMRGWPVEEVYIHVVHILLVIKRNLWFFLGFRRKAQKFSFIKYLLFWRIILLDVLFIHFSLNVMKIIHHFFYPKLAVLAKTFLPKLETV